MVKRYLNHLTPVLGKRPPMDNTFTELRALLIEKSKPPIPTE